METWAFVAKTMFAGREFAKILCGVRNYLIKESEDDAAYSFIVDRYIELKQNFYVRLIETLNRKTYKNVGHGWQEDNRWEDVKWLYTDDNRRWLSLICSHDDRPKASSAWL